MAAAKFPFNGIRRCPLGCFWCSRRRCAGANRSGNNAVEFVIPQVTYGFKHIRYWLPSVGQAPIASFECFGSQRRIGADKFHNAFKVVVGVAEKLMQLNRRQPVRGRECVKILEMAGGLHDHDILLTVPIPPPGAAPKEIGREISFEDFMLLPAVLFGCFPAK